MTWQLYLTEYAGDPTGDEENFVNYRTLYGHVIKGYPQISSVVIGSGKQGITIPNSQAYLSLEVSDTHLRLFLSECRHQLPDDEISIYSPDENFTLDEWLQRGFDLIQVSPRISAQGEIEKIIQVTIDSEERTTYYYLEWWNTDFGPFPEPLPESS